MSTTYPVGFPPPSWPSMTSSYVHITHGIPSAKYPSVDYIKELFPSDWNIKSVSVEITSYENIGITVKRVLSDPSLDVMDGIHKNMKDFCTHIIMSSDGETLVEYRFVCSHLFYSEQLLSLHQEIYDEQFHKDFATIDSKQV